MPDETDDNAQTLSLKIELEACTLEDLGIGGNGPVPETLGWCAAAINVVAIDPSEVELVITGDFAQSVRDRTLSDYYRENYNVDRGAGTVGGKTMTLADGSTAVLLPASAFMSIEDEDPEDREYRETTIKRTALHEAHHVAMNQAGEGSPSYDGDLWAWENMRASAESVISEYRAELGVAEFGGFVYQGWDFLDVLESLRTRIRASETRYQASLDVRALSVEVGTPAAETWRLLGYLAAFLRDPEGGFQPLPPEWQSAQLWQDVVGEHWEPFVAILEKVPSGAARIGRQTIDAVIDELATELQGWLRHIGFHFYDADDGPRFDIVGRHLLD